MRQETPIVWKELPQDMKPLWDDIFVRLLRQNPLIPGTCIYNPYTEPDPQLPHNPDALRGEVIFTGKGHHDQDGMWVDQPFKKGDIVVFAAFTPRGTTFEIQNQLYRLLRARDVLATDNDYIEPNEAPPMPGAPWEQVMLNNS